MPPDVVRPSPVRPVFSRVGIENIGHPHVIRRHQHLGYEIILVDKGLYRCRHNDLDVTMGEDGLLVVKPGDWHEENFGGECLRYFGVGFDLRVAEGMPISIFRENTPIVRQHFTVSRSQFVPIIEKMAAETRVGDFVSAHIQDALALEFFYRLVRAVPRDILCEYYLGTSREAGFSTVLLSVLNARLTRKLRVGEVAAELGMSESSLAHKCRKYLRCSPARLFLRVKLDRAMQMLKSTDMSAKEVGAYLGFDDQFHFSRVFKKMHGIPPSVAKHRRPPGA